MKTLNKLLDNAMKTCSPSNGEGLAAALGVTRSAVSKWKSGGVIAEKHLTALVALAGAAPETAVAVLRQQATTEAEKAVWGSLARRLGAAAAIAVALLASPQPVIAGETLTAAPSMHYAKWLVLRLRAAFAAIQKIWRAELRYASAPAVLA